MNNFINKVTRKIFSANRRLWERAKIKRTELQAQYSEHINCTFKEIAIDMVNLENPGFFEFTVLVSSNEKITQHGNCDYKIYIDESCSFIRFFLPSGIISNFDRDGNLQVKGTWIEGYNTFLYIRTPFHLASVEPILAKSTPFPDNNVCGFIVKGNNIKYIFFLHSKSKQIYKGSDRVDSSIFTAFRFEFGELTDVWDMGKKKQIEHYP